MQQAGPRGQLKRRYRDRSHHVSQSLRSKQKGQLRAVRGQHALDTRRLRFRHRVVQGNPPVPEQAYAQAAVHGREKDRRGLEAKYMKKACFSVLVGQERGGRGCGHF